jgi:hypothetical protein
MMRSQRGRGQAPGGVGTATSYPPGRRVKGAARIADGTQPTGPRSGVVGLARGGTGMSGPGTKMR